ncbi:Biogenesis of lysosome-related organelles complex 1 subunit 7 [Aphelenchoides bicaudatus]|nr:Biogenesis of lysosome-related organelles complex 1 subunit 7 [Aphelenchoides bicaudatus]
MSAKMNTSREEVQLKPMSDAIVRSTPEPAIGGGNDISEGIMDIIRPSITKLDEQVKNTRKSQLLLAGDITKMSEYLKLINDDEQMPFDLDKYVRKLDDSQKRITNVATRLQALHDRMSTLQRQIARENFKHKQQTGQPNNPVA